MILQTPITPAMREEANALANQIPSDINNSILSGNGRVAGSLGEIAVRDYCRELGVAAEIIGGYDYDILLGDGSRLEVKTKQCNTAPKPHYDCSVANYNQRQDCDLYVFTRVSATTVYLLGVMEKESFYRNSRQMRAGDTDSNILPTGNRYQFHADCRNVCVNQLVPFAQIGQYTTTH